MEPTSTVSHESLRGITEALQATLDPRVTNAIRQEALSHLEQVKKQPDAPFYGYNLSSDREKDPAVRYYGLQLLEFAIRYRWTSYTAQQGQQLNVWVKNLAGDVRPDDALFIRNKIAQLWVELAKRSWGDDWMDMDKCLVELWEQSSSQKGTVNKALVLYVLETLSEDVINNEDAVAGLRLEVLGNALNEIMIPNALYVDHASSRGNRTEMRHGQEGWLGRICAFFSDCVKECRLDVSSDHSRNMLFCATKALHAMRPTMSWISIRAAVMVNCVDCLFLPFYTDDFALQTAAIEVMYALLVRPYHIHWHDATATLLNQCLRADRIPLIRQAFERTESAPGEDDVKYTLQKKMSEVLSLLSDDVAAHPNLVDDKLDLSAFFGLLAAVLQSDSLVVSIPVLHSWSRLMGVQEPRIIDIVLQTLGTLIQTCSTRLLRYEALSEDDGDDVVQFLYEDFDTMPERHAFLGNYRRYCVSIIQSIARSRPLEALAHVMDQMHNLLLNGQYTVAKGFDASKYSKTSTPVLQFDAQFSVVSSTLKGFSLWCSDVAALGHSDQLHEKAERDMNSAFDSLRQWSFNIMDMHVDDPEVAAEVLQTLVSILKTVKAAPDFVLRVVQHLLTMRMYDNPAYTAFSEAVKTFETLRVLELQKLALGFANELLEVYHDLEPRIGVLAQKHSDEPRLEWGYRAFLFMVIHRAAGLDAQTRLNRLRQMLVPIGNAWQSPDLNKATSTFPDFCEALGLGDVAAFYQSYEFHKTQDWSSRQLDEAGQERQALIKSRSDQIPLRMTKCMLAATTEKLKPGTEEFDLAASLWGDLVPTILPDLLRLLQHAQAFHNMANWSSLPIEIQAVVKRTMQDRFWQSGISSESKDQFYARISGSKSSYEGIASVVRGTMRNIREQGYHIIYLLTKFDDHFYSLENLPELLADALFSDADALPANHLHPIINLTTGLVQRCPPGQRQRFLPPLLTRFFSKLDAKISSDWDAIGSSNDQNADDDNLSDEMRVESVLRQLTYSMVSFVPFLLEYDRHSTNSPTNQQPKPTLNDLVLSDSAVLVPMMLFCTHALRMRDTRCCTTICRVFRSIIPIFAEGDATMQAQVREFMSTDVLKACITSLNEPYFADMQKDLAAVIAQVVRLCSSKTNTPREVLLSLPDMNANKVNNVIAKVCKAQSERQQRSLILELLEGVRGVSIHEVGKIAPETPRKNNRNVSAMQQQYMEVEQRPVINGGDEVGLESVANLFGDA